MNQQRQNTHSTQQRAPSDAPNLVPEDIGKTNFVYATIVDAGLIQSNLTGRFPTTSAKGNKYFLALYDYDTNNILTEPMKNRGDQEMVRAYNKLIQDLIDHGFKPRLQRLDNECSKVLLSLLNQRDIQFQLHLRTCIAVTPLKELFKLSKITVLLDFARLIRISLSASGTACYHKRQ
jgi:hypothetical protein